MLTFKEKCIGCGVEIQFFKKPPPPDVEVLCPQCEEHIELINAGNCEVIPFPPQRTIH